MRRTEIINSARKWLNTPFHHQGRVMGAGVDCYGLIEMVARDFGIIVPENIKYSRVPDENQLILNLDNYAKKIPINEAGLGDIVVMQFLGKMRHLAFITDIGLIHSYEPIGKVIEHSLNEKWRRMIRRAYQLPGVTNG